MAKRTLSVETGQRFGRLTIVDPESRFPSKNPARPSGPRAPLVRCECGTVKQVLIYDLIKDKVISCGCHRTEVAERRIVDMNDSRGCDYGGASHHREFGTWQNIIQRCLNPKSPRWYRYGARGISIDDRWRSDPWLFLHYLDENLGPRPEGMSLDRIDNDGNYEPGNLRWATDSEQQRNQTRRKAS